MSYYGLSQLSIACNGHHRVLPAHSRSGRALACFGCISSLVCPNVDRVSHLSLWRRLVEWLWISEPSLFTCLTCPIISSWATQEGNWSFLQIRCLLCFGSADWDQVQRMDWYTVLVIFYDYKNDLHIIIKLKNSFIPSSTISSFIIIIRIFADMVCLIENSFLFNLSCHFLSCAVNPYLAYVYKEFRLLESVHTRTHLIRLCF